MHNKTTTRNTHTLGRKLTANTNRPSPSNHGNAPAATVAIDSADAGPAGTL
jgi:hypothetical protein